MKSMIGKSARSRTVAEAFAARRPEFYVIKFIGFSRPLVLERSAVEAARGNASRPATNVLSEENLTTSEFATTSASL